MIDKNTQDYYVNSSWVLVTLCCIGTRLANDVQGKNVEFMEHNLSINLEHCFKA